MSDKDFTSFNKSPAVYLDWSTFLITVLLVALGLISIYSATYIYSASVESGMSIIFIRQLIAAVIGLIGMVVIMYLPERWIFNSTYPVYGFSIILLLLVLFIGKSTAGTKGWINFGGFTIQPAEIAKLSLILIVARHLSLKGTDIRTLRDLGIILGLTAIPILLILRQPDFGSATVLIAMILGVLLWTGFDSFVLYFLVCLPIIVISALVGEVWMITSIIALSFLALLFRKKLIITITAIIIFVLVGTASPIIYKSLQPHQQARITTFLNPDSDPRGKGYNVIQSKMAVGSGGLTGKGFLQGTQTQLRYIPKQWTDFIFSVPTEEFGFIGGISVILLLTSLIWRAVSIATETDNKFFSIIAIGIASVLIYHTIINVGMAIGLMPVMGIPLPFMSAGGTSLLVNFAMVGLLLNFYRNKMKR